MPKTTALTHSPKCDECGEPAVVTYRKDGRTINRCFDCLDLNQPLDGDTKLLIELGLIKSKRER